MQTFAFVIAGLGSLIALVYIYSLWTVFGFAYMAGLLLVGLFALLKRNPREINFKSESA